MNIMSIIKYHNLFCLLFLILLLLSCGKTQDNNSFPILEFRVDPELLDSMRYIDKHSIVFHPPKGFITLPDSIVEKAQNELRDKKEGEVPPFLLEHAFVNPQMTSAVILISSIKPDSAELIGFSDFIKKYGEKYLSFFPNAETSTFSVNNIHCWQARRIEAEQIRFRLLIDRGTNSLPSQLDFNFPLSSDADVGRILESVIGSIKNIH